MIVEDGLAGDGIHIAVGGDHPVAFATAEPDPALAVLPAQIPHAVPDLTAFFYFRQRIGSRRTDCGAKCA